MTRDTNVDDVNAILSPLVWCTGVSKRHSRTQLMTLFLNGTLVPTSAAILATIEDESRQVVNAIDLASIPLSL